MPTFFLAIGALISSAVGAVSAGVGALFGGTFGTTLLSVGLSLLSALLFRPKEPKPEDVQTSVRNPTAPRIRHYGRIKASGPWVFAESKDGIFYKVIALGTGELDAIEEYWIDDNLVTIDGSGQVQEEPYNWHSDGDYKVLLYPRLGTDSQLAYVALTAQFPEWDSNHRGRGVSSLMITQKDVGAEDFNEVFPNGIHTNYRVVVRGSKLYNPITQTIMWTDNAADVIRDYMTHEDGMRLPESLFTTPNAETGWYRAHAIAYHSIPLKAGGTEYRYRLWGSYALDERPADVLGRMLNSCDGMILPTPDGGITLDIGLWEEPQVTLGEEAILGFSELSHGKDVVNSANIITATYLSPVHDYQATDADPLVDDADVALRGSIPANLEYNMSPSHGQARRLMKLAKYRANPNWIGTFQCNLRAVAAFGQRFIRIYYPLFGINEVFEVVDFRFNIGEGMILQGCTVLVQSMPEEAYNWDAEAEEGDAPIAESTEVDHSVPEPTGATFIEERFAVNGENFSRGVISVPSIPSLSLRLEARYKKVIDSNWQMLFSSDSTTKVLRTGVLEDGVQHEAQVRYATSTGRSSDWAPTTSMKMTPLADTVAPGALTTFTASSGELGRSILQVVTAGGDTHLKRLAIYLVPAGGVLDRVTHFGARIAAGPGTTFNYTHGDATRTTILTNGTFAADANWNKGTGWTIAAGVATKAAGTAANLIQVGMTSFGTGSAVYRYGFRVTTYTAGTVQPFTGTTTALGTSVNSAGQKLGTITPANASTQFGFTTGATTNLSIDDAILYLQTAACAPQGTWDIYAIPENGSGVEGPQSVQSNILII